MLKLFQRKSKFQKLNFKLLKNDYDDILAVEVIGYNFKTKDFSGLMSLIRNYGIIIFKKANLSIEDYHKWQLNLGYHQISDMWCTHKKYPIFYEVTNKETKKGQKGLFGDKEINWHCANVFAPDGPELLGLYAILIPKTPKSKTFFANSIPYWKNLSQEDQKSFENTYIEVAPKVEDTYEKHLISNPPPKNQMKDRKNHLFTRDIRRSINFERKYYEFYSEPRYLYRTPLSLKKNFLKLIPEHTLGVKGVYFPYFHISDMTDLNKKSLLNSKKLFEKIKKDYILNGRYVYEHNWEEGDIVLADQLTGLHKRNNIWKEADDFSLQRNLLRSVCWYKSEYRKNFIGSI